MTNNEKELMPERLEYGQGKYDDWGIIKDAKTGFCLFQINCNIFSDDLNEHRRNKTDPCETFAKEIVKAWNTRPQPSTDKPCETCNGDDLKNIIDAYEGLIIYNLWRRGSDLVEDQPDPKTLGIWIETAIKVMRQTITQPKAVDVEDILNSNPFQKDTSEWRQFEYSKSQLIDIWNKSDKKINTNERVKVLENALKNTSKHRDKVVQQLKVATEALKEVIDDCIEYSGDPNEEHPLHDIFKPHHYVQKALQQIEGGRGSDERDTI